MLTAELKLKIRDRVANLTSKGEVVTGWLVGQPLWLGLGQPDDWSWEEVEDEVVNLHDTGGAMFSGYCAERSYGKWVFYKVA